MTLDYILVLISISILLGFVSHPLWRVYLLFITSVVILFVIQPALPIRYLDFYLPSVTLALAVSAWVLTTPRDARNWRRNWPALAILAGSLLILGLTRYLDGSLPILPSRAPQVTSVLLFIFAAGLILLFTTMISSPGKILSLSIGILVIALLALIKLPELSLQVSIFLRNLNQQSLETASAFDIRWLGFSYVAFRIIHTIRDRQSGRLPAVSLAEYVVYIVFFPTIVAGPIDRLERFVGDLRRSYQRVAQDWGMAGQRIVIGLFKKFVIADSLALFALNATNATQVEDWAWAWILLYAFSLQIYFDFSGYTDIAIGLGYLLGFKLPENFNSPYLKPNITQFWNTWHMSLTQWFRAYYFNPLTRSLRTLKKPLSIGLIVFITQISTMVLIGLWHGATWSFIFWGIWHGLGLFAHNRWSEWTKGYFSTLSSRLRTLLAVGGTVVTFNFVALGWVFFVLPEPGNAYQFFQTLFHLI
jgi:D-alanyl-lipoteichoic acid acyltransferase DltB (MBOAT superfamily)